MEQKELKKDYCSDGKSYWQGGQFYPDQTPIEMPLGYHVPETLESMIARMVHDQHYYANKEFDNIDEAEDLDVMDEDPLPTSKHEFTEMQEEVYKGRKKKILEEADKLVGGETSPSNQPAKKPQGEAESPLPKGEQGKGQQSVVAQ